METYETTQPWVIYAYGKPHDRWWPFWSSTCVLGKAKIGCECAICGERITVTLSMPRFGPVKDNGKHPLRQAFLDAHQHPDQQRNPLTWARPLRNPAAFGGFD